MCSRESSTRAFSASYYRKTTFLTRVLPSLFSLPGHFGIATKKSITARVEFALAAILLNAKNFAWERRGRKGPGTVRRKRNAGTTLCRTLLRNTDVSRGMLFQGESLGLPSYYFRCGSPVVCLWASATTSFGAAVSASDWWSSVITFGMAISASDRWASYTTFGAAAFASDSGRPLLLPARRSSRLTIGVRHYLWRGDLFVWPLGVRYHLLVY